MLLTWKTEFEIQSELSNQTELQFHQENKFVEGLAFDFKNASIPNRATISIGVGPHGWNSFNESGKLEGMTCMRADNRVTSVTRQAVNHDENFRSQHAYPLK